METERQRELWGGETRKAMANFPVSGEPTPVPVARWLGRLKAAAARANAELGLLDPAKAERIAAAGDAIARGEHDDHFPIDVFQTGSGTSSNMNANEVIASLAGERLGRAVHPNDHVNASQSSNHFEAQGARDGLVEASGQLRTVAVSLYKIANDLRWMGSGPRAGLREINIPDLQPGSSIMPGKVNPVIPEAVCMVCAQVIGNDAAIAFGGAAGNFELNVMLPLLARNILESVRLLANVSRLLADRCITGITANAEVARVYAEGSPSIVTPLNRYIGYEEAAKV